MTSNDTKRERFDRVAHARVRKIKELLDLLQNCANTHNYEYTQEDVEAIFHDLSQSLKEAKKSFQIKKKISNQQ